MKKISLTLFLIIVICLANTVIAQEIKTKYLNLEKGLAIQGYDPVAYFTENKAVEGKSTISSQHNGATFYFSTKQNKTLFDKEPLRYEPAYGGYCAYAMAFGDKVKIDPETFKIKNDRLFLFYNFRFNNTLKDWNKNEAKLFKDSEKKWEEIISVN